MQRNKHKKTGKISYGLEIFILLLTTSGIYFLFTDMDLAGALTGTAVLLIDQFAEIKSSLLAFSQTLAREMRPSDMLGVALIGTTIILSLLRLRYRLVLSKQADKLCPECGSQVAQHQRSLLQRAIAWSMGLESAVYKCVQCKHKKLIYRYKISPSRPVR